MADGQRAICKWFGHVFDVALDEEIRQVRVNERKKATKSDGTCPDHGPVTATQIVGAAVVIQDPCTTLEFTLWTARIRAVDSRSRIGAAWIRAVDR